MFTSRREKRLWLATLLIISAIYSTAVLARPISQFLREKQLLTPLYIFCLLLICLAILTQGFFRRPGKLDIGLAMGIIAVYLLVGIRMEIPEERTHLAEYSILAIFVYAAIKERMRVGKKPLLQAGMAIVLTSILGCIDECIQWFLPNRVFDLRDVAFNMLAAALAIGAILGITWLHDCRLRK